MPCERALVPREGIADPLNVRREDSRNVGATDDTSVAAVRVSSIPSRALANSVPFHWRPTMQTINAATVDKR